MTNKSRPHDLKRIRLLRGNPMAGKIHRQAKKNDAWAARARRYRVEQCEDWGREHVEAPLAG
jgi:hypothetical protein